VLFTKIWYEVWRESPRRYRHSKRPNEWFPTHSTTRSSLHPQLLPKHWILCTVRSFWIRNSRAMVSSRPSMSYTPSRAIDKRNALDVHSILFCHAKPIPQFILIAQDYLCRIFRENVTLLLQHHGNGLHRKIAHRHLAKIITCLYQKPPGWRLFGSMGRLWNGIRTLLIR